MLCFVERMQRYFRRSENLAGAAWEGFASRLGGCEVHCILCLMNHADC
jgi:hypothetical protein